MKPLILLFCGAVILSGCASHDPLHGKDVVTYFDRNGDGKVDQEKHHYPKMADVDWELRDDDFDGHYEKKIVYGFAVRETAVNIRVPRVKIHTQP